MMINATQDGTGEWVTDPNTSVDEAKSEGVGVSNDKQPMIFNQVNLLLFSIGNYIQSRIPSSASQGLPSTTPVDETTQAFQNAVALVKPLFRPCDYEGAKDLDAKTRSLIQDFVNGTSIHGQETLNEEFRARQQERPKIRGKSDRYINQGDYFALIREHLATIDRDLHPIDGPALSDAINNLEGQAKAVGLSPDENMAR